MKALMIISVFLASCSTAQTPKQACENYCSVTGTPFLEDKDNACVCKTDFGIRVSAGSCLSRASDQNKAIQCLQIAKNRCEDKDTKLSDPASICDFVKTLGEQGYLK
jgi:hypothetical protein